MKKRLVPNLNQHIQALNLTILSAITNTTNMGAHNIQNHQIPNTTNITYTVPRVRVINGFSL